MNIKHSESLKNNDANPSNPFFCGFGFHNERRKRASISISIAIIILLSIFQIPILDSTVNAEPQKVFTLGMANDVSTLNPFAAIEDNEYVIMDLIYEYIFFPSIYNDTWPSLVSSGWFMDGITAASSGTDFSSFSSYSSPSDWPLGSIWEYNLTEKVFWNDGVEFTAEDVAWTLSQQIGPNYMTYWAFQPTTRWINYVEVITDHKFRIFFCEYNTKQPYPIAFGEHLMIPIMPKHIFEDEAITYLAYEWNGVPSVGIGPFMGTEDLEKEILAGETCTLIRNPYYNFIEDGVKKGLGAPWNMTVEMDKILIKFFSEETTLSLAARSGEVDMVEIAAGTYINWIQDSTMPEHLRLLKLLSTWQFSRQVGFNAYADAAGDMNPLRLDPAVHRASSLATNKSLFIDIIYKGLGVEGVGLISPYAEDWWWEPGDELSTFNITNGVGDVIFNYSKPMKDVMGYDLALANEILNESGYDEWSGGSFGNGHRIAGPLVGERMQYLFGFNPSVIVGEALDLSLLIASGPFVDQQICTFLIQQWRDIGIKLTQELVSAAIWSEYVYSYTHEMQITYWSGNYDPNYLCFIPTSYALYGWNEFGTDSEEYDSLYLEQVRTLDYEERKKRSDECIKWQYLSGSINTLVYPEKCFAYSEERWTNWVLEEEPFYSYFDVEYISDGEETSSNLMLFIGAVMIVVAVSAIAITSAIMLKKRKERIMLEEKDDEIDRLS